MLSFLFLVSCFVDMMCVELGSGFGVRNRGALSSDWFVNGCFGESLHNKASHCCTLLPSTL